MPCVNYSHNTYVNMNINERSDDDDTLNQLRMKYLVKQITNKMNEFSKAYREILTICNI